jgi:serine/threonine protein kinase
LFLVAVRARNWPFQLPISALNHPNISTIYGIEEYEGKPFIVMELLEGRGSLHPPGSIAWPTCSDNFLDIAIQVCSGLQAAHAKGIIHRDVMPANIFLTRDGPVKILDFGLAKLASPEEEQVTTEGDTSFPLSRSSHERPAQQSSLLDLPSLTMSGTAIGTGAYRPNANRIRGGGQRNGCKGDFQGQGRGRLARPTVS